MTDVHGLQHQMTLSGGWRLRASADVGAGGEDVSQPGFDASGWMQTCVPSTVLASLVMAGQYEDPYYAKNLQRIPQERFRESWWYRTEFHLSEGQTGGPILLEFDGINYAANIWLNGRSLATANEARGAFRRFQYDASRLAERGQNVLAMEVIPPKPGDFSTGFADWNPPPPDGNMGVFRPVRLRFCGSISIEDPFVQTRLNLDTLAEADLMIATRLVNRRDMAVSGTLEGRIEDRRFAQDIRLGPHEERLIDFTSLHIMQPRLWWPHDLGRPELYDLELRFTVDSEVSDAAAVRFGIREAADYRTPDGHRGFKINGREVLIRGAGWTDDLLLADTPETIEAEVRYVRHMNLNCIRCEGIWGKDQTLYDLCDAYGVLMMVGWNCHWEHEQYLGKPADELYGGATSPEDIDLLGRYWQDQLLWLRNHPSIFVWAVASDKLPAPELERKYVAIFREHDPTRPYLVSTGGVGSEQRIVCRKELVSEVSGGSGVKMLGPYEYTPPVYWYTDTRRGGAYGFNTETSPGAIVPTLESLRRMLPAGHLWPVDEYWHFHCGLNEFTTLDCYREAVRRRYGEPGGVEEFARKAQVMNYELVRPMFEAFRVNRGRATGVIQWMLNAAWPKTYWQLYDWYLMPTGAFYGAKKACEPVQLVYHYGDGNVYLVNDRPVPAEGLRSEVRLYDAESRLFFASHFQTDAAPMSSQRVCALPPFPEISTTYFLHLRLSDADGREVADNFYWLSSKPDVLDYAAKVTPWEYYTPSSEYADLTMLNSLPPAQIDVQYHAEDSGLTVELTNRCDRIAFAVELLLTNVSTGEPVVPIFWQDNYVSILPNEAKTVTAMFHAAPARCVLIVRGWNIEQRRYALDTAGDLYGP